MAVSIETTSANRERGSIPLPGFSFHRENVNHDVFRLNIVDGETNYETTVRAWGNAVDAVRAFTACIGDRAAVKAAVRDIHRTGYASVGGMNIRLTPIA
ncbi:hypothetical protein [Streptomyces wuyuanensis]|uniref:hypothetical protein n=1 Tax=Streptomyces wuyuanensis TaxID=1196353 RepID=UPI00344251EA